MNKTLEDLLEELDYLQRIEEMLLDYSWADLETFWFDKQEYPISALNIVIQQLEQTIKLIRSRNDSKHK